MSVTREGIHDVKHQITMAAMFSVSEVLSMCKTSYFGISEDESNCDEGEEVHSCRSPCLLGPRVVALKEVAALSRAITSEYVVVVLVTPL